MATDPHDQRVRLAAFAWLERQSEIHPEVLPREILVHGFEFDGQRVSLISQQGIFKPQILSEIPLSISTTIKGPYKDTFTPDGQLHYSYRGTDASHRDNVGLRLAMQRRVPLIYFHAIAPGKYCAAWPVFVVGDDPAALRIRVEVDDHRMLAVLASQGATSEQDRARRSYATRELRVRLHQQQFRVRVLAAYRAQCSLCRLRHEELLDAAHIIADSEERGEPVVSNGLALCKLHHAAFDRHFLAIRPDYKVEVAARILKEKDGPMLLHGLQAMNGRVIQLPSSRAQHPDRDRLEERLRAFRAAG